MRDHRPHIATLGRLHELPSDEERAIAFRQGMACLAQVATDPAAVPFEGTAPEQLLVSVRSVLAGQLLEQLDFLSRSAAACSLYALASALPATALERRELGRRVLFELQSGEAGTFVALATSLALGSARLFEGAQMRARLSLVLQLPASSGVCGDPLAFALVSQRELAARFLIAPAHADLPSRRLSARVLEQAARYAALRARQGDDCELAVFAEPHIERLFVQLLSDREPLVARHVAAARGFLSAYLPRHAEEMERDLMALQSVSRARRGATSLAARMALAPEQTLPRALELVRGRAASRDAGVAAALVQGLGRVLEIEPEAGEQLLVAAVERGGLLAIQALVELMSELGASEFCLVATTVAQKHLQQYGEKSEGEGSHLELRALLEQALGPPDRVRAQSLPKAIDEALSSYAQVGPREALAPAVVALRIAHAHVERLAQLSGRQDLAERVETYRILHELDVGLLESSALFDLLSSGLQAADAEPPSAELTSLLTRLLSLLATQEEAPHPGAEPVLHLSVRMRRLRTLLHLLDTDFNAGEEQLASVREAQLVAVYKLSQRVSLDAPSSMDRVIHAALGRGVDALVRGEVLELSDVFLQLAHAVPLPEGLMAIAECSLLPALSGSLRALSLLVVALDPSSRTDSQRVVAALGELAHALPSDDSPRTEALRRALLGLFRALEAMLSAHSIRELIGARRALTLFEAGVIELAYLQHGARRRFGAQQVGAIIDESPVVALARALESGASQGELSDLDRTIDWLESELTRTLAPPFARALSRVLAHVRAWPLDSSLTHGAARIDAVQPASSALAMPARTEACPLPSWVPPSRRLDGYFVVRPLGTGLASSAFLVKRNDERTARAAPGLVLKVPHYDDRSARVLSEREFESAFERELPALLGIPPQENLASLIAVSSQRSPKPFLVMEWVEGPTLSRVRKRKLHAPAVLDGLLAGLEALHATGIGHFDVSPSRIVLRTREGALQPVLVDFGLAGRTPRPGCGDARYTAPELWTGELSSPFALDIYALGCLAHELVTGRPLFQAASESRLAQAHASHDGAPPGVLELAKDARTAPLADWLTLCLRHAPEQRATATELRKALRALS